MRKDWHLIRVIRAQHISKDGSLLWEAENILNTVHYEGEEFILTAMFSDSSIIPTNYYFGLDARNTIEVDDTMETVAGEPSGNNYSRQPASSTGFTVSQQLTGFRADSPLAVFSASGGDWTAVKNLFMTTEATGTSCPLIATVSLSSEITIHNGEKLTLQMGISLTDELV